MCSLLTTQTHFRFFSRVVPVWAPFPFTALCLVNQKKLLCFVFSFSQTASLWSRQQKRTSFFWFIACQLIYPFLFNIACWKVFSPKKNALDVYIFLQSGTKASTLFVFLFVQKASLFFFVVVLERRIIILFHIHTKKRQTKLSKNVFLFFLVETFCCW